MADKPEKNDDEADNKVKYSPTDVMVNILSGMETVKFWRTPGNDVYVDIGAVTFPVKSSAFRGFLRKISAERRPDKTLTSYTIDEVVSHFYETTLIKEDVIKPHCRVGYLGDAMYYDLGGADGAAVEFKGGTWKVVPKSPVRFVRGQGTLAQIVPVKTDKKLPDLLRPFLTPKDDNDLALLTAWVIASYNPMGPYPVLILTGEQGSAKSTTTRVLRRLVDPHEREMRSLPKDTRDFVSQVKNTFVLGFDNVSRISEEMSDSLCRLSTGHGALGGRALYTDADDASFTAMRPLILNGITDFAVREDLVDRSFQVHLPAIPQSRRVDDASYWAKFNDCFPEILGAVFDAVALAWYTHNDIVIPAENRIRMMGTAKWCVAAEVAMVWPKDFMIKALYENWNAGGDKLIENSAVAQTLLRYFENDKAAPLRGDLGQISTLLTPHRTGGEEWPSTSKGFASMLKRIQPVLRRAGVEIFHNGANSRTRRAEYEIRRMELQGHA